MKIEREEFKELVELYKDAWSTFKECSEYINEEKLDELMFPLFTWVSTKLGMNDENYDDLMFELITSKNGLAIKWGEPEADGYYSAVEFSNDLDVIYDTYLNK